MGPVTDNFYLTYLVWESPRYYSRTDSNVFTNWLTQLIRRRMPPITLGSRTSGCQNWFLVFLKLFWTCCFKHLCDFRSAYFALELSLGIFTLRYFVGCISLDDCPLGSFFLEFSFWVLALGTFVWDLPLTTPKVNGLDKHGNKKHTKKNKTTNTNIAPIKKTAGIL